MACRDSQEHGISIPVSPLNVRLIELRARGSASSAWAWSSCTPGFGGDLDGVSRSGWLKSKDR